MAKIRVNLYIEDDFSSEYEIFTSIKIGQFIKFAIEKIDNKDFINILETSVFYENTLLDHSKTFEYYTDFQYKKTNIYKISIIPKYYRQHSKSINRDVISNVINISNNRSSGSSTPNSLMNNIVYVNSSSLNNIKTNNEDISDNNTIEISKSLPNDLDNYKTYNIDIRLKKVEEKLDEILKIIKNNYS